MLKNFQRRVGILFFWLAGIIPIAAQGDRYAVVTIQTAIEGGDLQRAAGLLQEALKQHPNDGGLLNLRGILHARKDEIADARKDFGEAVKHAPQLTAAWQNLGRACQQLEEAACAMEAWHRVLRTKPRDDEAHGSLALLYEKQGRFAESLVELDAGKGNTLPLRCLDLSGLNRIKEAKVVAHQLAKESDFTEADLEAMRGPLDLPQSAPVLAVLVEGLDSRGALELPSLQRLAMEYEQLHRTADARKTLERIAKLDPTNTAHLLELARLAEASKDFEGALGYLAHARDLEPNNAQIHFLFGSVAGELNLPIEARSAFEKALAIEPGNANYNFAMGSVILQTRDAATAASYFDKFVAARPADGRGHYALGLAHFAAGDYGRAKEQMKVAESEPGLAAASEYYLGRMARLEGDLDEALRQLHKSVERIPTLSEPHTELGRIALSQGKVEDARTELARALQLAPNSFQANEQLLILYKRTHDPRAQQQAEALKQLDEERSRRAELMLRTVEVQR